MGGWKPFLIPSHAKQSLLELYLRSTGPFPESKTAQEKNPFSPRGMGRIM